MLSSYTGYMQRLHNCPLVDQIVNLNSRAAVMFRLWGAVGSLFRLTLFHWLLTASELQEIRAKVLDVDRFSEKGWRTRLDPESSSRQLELSKLLTSQEEQALEIEAAASGKWGEINLRWMAILLTLFQTTVTDHVTKASQTVRSCQGEVISHSPPILAQC